MGDTLAQNAERLRQSRTDRAGSFSATAPNVEGSRGAALGTLVAGARIFDSVSGLEGTVLAASGLGAVGAGEVEIRLEGGLLARRRPDLLIVRPTPPAVSK